LNPATEHAEHKEIFQVIGAPPNLLLRFGVFAIGLFFVVVIALSYLIKYPEEISSRVILTTENPVVRIFSKTNGQIDLYVQNKSWVVQSQPLALVKNSANFNDVTQLEKVLKDSTLTHARGLNVGAIQNSFSAFNEAREEYDFFLTNNNYRKQITVLNDEVKVLERLIQSLKTRHKFQGDLIALAETDFKRNEALFNSKTISSYDFEKIKTSLIQSRIQFENSAVDIESNSIRYFELKSQIISVEKTFNEERRKKKLLLMEARDKVLAEIGNWKDRFLIVAPNDGMVTFTSVKSKNQFVNSDEELMTVEPTRQTEKIFGKTFLTGEKIGKVKKGEKVVLQLDGYPYQEFGSIIGVISSISSTPSEKGYVVEIDVDQSLETSYHKKLSFTSEMGGNAKIIIENRRFIQLIFNSIRSLFDRNRTDLDADLK
jgi:hypothetical protein